MSDQHTTVQYQLRLPEELRDEIKESAKTHNRSMNADIVARLEQSFTSESPLHDESEVKSIKDQLESMTEAYHQTQHRFDKLFKIFENDIDLSSYLVQKTPSQTEPNKKPAD